MGGARPQSRPVFGPRTFGVSGGWQAVPFLAKTNKKKCSRQLQCEVPCWPVMSSILPCPPCLLWQGRGVWWGVWWGLGGWGEGVGVRGRGQGTFHPTCHVLHYHMVLRPKGTSHNYCVTLWLRLALEAPGTPEVKSCTPRFALQKGLFYNAAVYPSDSSRDNS